MMTASVPNAAIRIRRLTDPTPAEVQGLADVLLDAVESGASVGFMASLTREAAVAFWTRVADDTRAGRRALLIAEDEINGTPQICGTVHLILDLPPNQPHRADLVKMLVHRRARRRGVGAALMRAAEALARDLSRTLLVLDAVTEGDAARLYERLGWTRVGDIPAMRCSPMAVCAGRRTTTSKQAPRHRGIKGSSETPNPPEARKKPRNACGVGQPNRGDSTAIELFLEGVRVWAPGIRRLLCAKAVSEEAGVAPAEWCGTAIAAANL